MAARSQVVLPRIVSLMRIVSQGLASTRQAHNVHSVVGSLLAVQGQQVSSLPHALLARCPGALGSDVAREFNSSRLIRSRPMRGTVHVTTAEDYHWLRLTLNARPGSFTSREEARMGVTNRLAHQAAALAWELIQNEGGKTSRTALFSTWLENLDISNLEQPSDQRRLCNLLMWRLDRTGEVIEAPLGKNQHYFVDARTLPAADSKESGFYMTAADQERGLVEVARRYITGHGPVSVADLARWTSLPKSTALSCLEAAVQEDASLGRFRLAEERLVPASAPKTLREAGDLHYLPADLPDTVADTWHEASRTMFLPSFDELHVGYDNRTCLTDDAGEDLINPHKNGMLRPLVVDQGRVVGVRPGTGLEWLKAPSARLRKTTEALVSDMMSRLAR